MTLAMNLVRGRMVPGIQCLQGLTYMYLSYRYILYNAHHHYF